MHIRIDTMERCCSKSDINILIIFMRAFVLIDYLTAFIFAIQN